MNDYPKIFKRRSTRLKGYDYRSSGIYFITICCRDRECLLGKITDGQMILNELGRIAFTEWEKTSQIRNNVQLGDFVIMPNHIHGILVLNDRRGVLHTPITQKCEKNEYLNEKGVFNTPLRSPSETIGSIVRGYKSAVTKQINILMGRNFTNKSINIWQRNYYEHIIRNEISLNKIIEYIQSNPSNWDSDRFNL